MTPQEPRDQPKSSGLNFSLPELPRASKTGQLFTSERLLMGIAALVLVQIVLTLTSRPAPPAQGRGGANPDAAATSLDADALKKLALKMEQQGLTQAAAGAWNEYLAAARPDAGETASVLYRTGKLHQDAHDYEAALNAFYRAEALRPEDTDLATDLGQRIAESLEAMGRFAALRHELTGRVALDQSAAQAAAAVVAEIGSEKITEADLDRKIEERIESELARFGSRLDAAAQSKQKEAMLAQFAGKEARLQFLQQLVAEEVLYRKARQIELAEKPEIRRQLEETRRAFLAGLVMQRRLDDYARISQDEVKARYEANKEKLRVPESLRLSRISLPTAEAAKARIAQGREGSDWEELAEPVTKGQPIPGLKPDAKLDALWTAPAREVISEPFPAADGAFHVFLVRERTESRIPAFEEVSAQLAQETQRAKEEQVQGELLEQLRREFDVVLHFDRFGKPDTGDKPQP